MKARIGLVVEKGQSNQMGNNGTIKPYFADLKNHQRYVKKLVRAVEKAKIRR